MKYIGENAVKKLISLIKGDLATKQPTITASGILKGDGSGTVTAADTQEATLVDVPNGLLKGDGTTISAAVAGTDYVEPNMLESKADVDLQNTKAPNSLYWEEQNQYTLSDTNQLYFLNGAYFRLTSNSIRRSTDFESWTTVYNSQVNDICYGGGKYVALNTGKPKIIYSEDGSTWQEGTVPSDLETYEWSHICYGNSKFIVTSYGSGEALYSSDGITWILSTSTMFEEDSGCTTGICYANGKFVAVSNSEFVYYSSDGITWSPSRLPEYLGNDMGICYGDGKFVAFVDSSNITYYSTDGITWLKNELQKNISYYDCIYVNDKFLLLNSYDNTILYSDDGITWSESLLPCRGEAAWICYDGDKTIIQVYDFGSEKYKILFLTSTVSNMLNYYENLFLKKCDAPPVYNTASSTRKGLVYLEDKTGFSTVSTMTQKSITNAINNVKLTPISKSTITAIWYSVTV